MVRGTTWSAKRLSHNFVQASLFEQYTIKFSTVRRDSGLLEHDRINTNTKAVDAALDDLQWQKVLMSWSKEETRGPRNKVVDVKYTLRASMEFIDKVKTANARQRDAKGMVHAAGTSRPADPPQPALFGW